MLYKDKNVPIKDRIDDLLNRMTVEEKVAQLTSCLPTHLLKDGSITQENLFKIMPYGLGRVSQFSYAGIAAPGMMPGIANIIQEYAVEKTRLGIPIMFQSEALNGFTSKQATNFPSPINLASMFAPKLVEEMATIIKEELLCCGVKQALCPVLDIARDPRWGRCYETYGEDPHLVSQNAIAYVSGLQANKKEGVLATAKHFLGYSETQGGINQAVSRINDKELYDVFATPFQAAINKAGLDSIMSSYSEYDGVSITANKKILRTLLREKMKFDGVLMTDGAAMTKLINYFGTAKDESDAAIQALEAGVDAEIPGSDVYSYLVELIKKGELDEKFLNESVTRVLKTKFEYGLFENPYVDFMAFSQVYGNEKYRQKSKKMADESIVLLKNNHNALPIKKKTKVALIGPHSNTLRGYFGGYTYAAGIDMIIGLTKGKSATFHGVLDDAEKNAETKNPFAGILSAIGLPEDIEIEQVIRDNYPSITLFEQLQKEEYELEVKQTKGCSVLENIKNGTQDAMKLAEEADVIVMAVGGLCGWTNATCGEGMDSVRIAIPEVQEKLIKELSKAGKKIILVLFNGRPLTTVNVEPYVDAIVETWLIGQEGSRSIADVLTGKVNPSGKLPMTVPRTAGQIPIFHYHKRGSGYDMKDNTIFLAPGEGYVDCKYTPLYYFGHGLSYTDFKLSNFKMTNNKVDINSKIKFSVDIENIGGCAGSEVIQVYYRDYYSKVTRPMKQLVMFEKVYLKANEIRKIDFTIPVASLGFTGVDDKFIVEPGAMQLMIGFSSEKAIFKKDFELVGETREIGKDRVF